MKIETSGTSAGAAGIRSSLAAIDLYQEVRAAIRQALCDTLARMTAEEHLDVLVSQVLDDTAAVPPIAPHHPSLSVREAQILDRIRAGESNKAIARALGLSLHTVKRHVANILAKLGVRSRVQAAMWTAQLRH